MRKAFMRQVKLMLLVLLGYLVQVCVMPYLKVGDVVPSLLCVVIAIVTVGYGKLRALWVGAFYGILMETMLPTVKMMNLMYYPVSALFCSVFFADKSVTRLQFERSTGGVGRNRSPFWRTVLCTALNVLIYEIVNVVYMYLGGAALTTAQVGKSMTDILATTALAFILTLPIRKLLGFRKPEPEDPAEQRFGRRPNEA